MAKTPGKPGKKSGAKLSGASPRQIKKPSYKSFRMSKRIKGQQLPGAFRLFAAATATLRNNWKVFLGVALIYGLFNVFLVQGLNAFGDISETKSALDEAVTGNFSQLMSGLAIFAQLVGSSGNTGNAAAGVYQLILALVTSLALIWTLRQLYAGHKVRVRDGFYNGMAPLVKFVLVLVVIFLQIIPMAIGLGLYGSVVTGGIAVTFVEQLLWALFAFFATLVSLYMLTSSIFALYIVTLPDMTPLSALRSARKLVANRRWSVMRKVLFLPLALVLLAALVVFPIIMFATPATAWVFFAVSMLLLPAFHSYMYALYRRLVEMD